MRYPLTLEYSICITHYNNRPTIKKSLDSILSQINEKFEIVVVDNFSNDGSQEVLQQYANAGTINLVRGRSSRGKGRQIAFENSKGLYVIANMDLDDVFLPHLSELLSLYHSACEGDLLWARSIDQRSYWGGENFTLAPRKLIEEIGGWRDLQWGEDWELVSRAARHEHYKWCDFKFLEEVNAHHERSKPLEKLRSRFKKYRDNMRCGRPIFSKGEHVTVSQRLVEIAVRMSLPFYENYSDPFNKTFNPYDSKYYLEASVHVAKDKQR